jgi:hypothetical protein
MRCRTRILSLRVTLFFGVPFRWDLLVISLAEDGDFTTYEHVLAFQHFPTVSEVVAAKDSE